MSREEYIKFLIKKRGYTIKEFAAFVEIPYTTILSMLKNLGGSAVDSVIKICRGLEITIDDLEKNTNGNKSGAKPPLDLSLHETTVMQAYREQPAMQPAVDKLLGVAADEKDEKEKIQPAKSGKSVSLPANQPEEKSSETDANPDEGIRVFRAAKSINNDQPPQIVTLTKEQAELLDNTPFIDLDI